MVTQQTGLLMVAMLCLLYDLQPADLESLAHQLAEFDAVNDHFTEKQHVACN
ncbi:hypothetical protein [Enterobacter ludwigii]|uniref:hypothetical protein n=1 Tax=Enterobacter ludwigii TaxID=299767 RepID=UPI00288B2B6B|nr:hypothetical protein [Enterobacter ludwigii]WNI43798.1 hypothetical protein RIK66_15625 [Enterobacter ludwigii]WNI55500.1 hypothetical protein RIL74_06915 [Enterobacter ludwigii]WNI80593.1 hypothetical protein RIK68_19785 [Enterobacter ludwigii]HCR2147462.1 hypothetical protein [Enterobacter kobei]